MASSRNAPPADSYIPEWIDAVMIIVTGISGSGLVVATIGLFLLKSDLLLLIGVCVVTAAGAAWAVAGLLLICHIVRLWLSDSGKARKASRPATPE